MNLTFHGAARTTTGSKFVFQVNGNSVLVDCGLYQGRRAEMIERNSRLPFGPADVSAVVLSHGHIDHTGIIPVLSKHGFAGRIHCTMATADLCSIMLVDSAHIQEQDAEFMTRKHAKHGLPAAEPLYTQADAAACLEQFAGVSYRTPKTVADGVTATWFDAGHMIGSAGIVLELEERGRKIRVGFTGDIGRGNNDLLDDPEPLRDIDYLLIESTYGGQEHENIVNVNARICSIVNRACDRKGKVIIPAFAVGRIQQLLFTLGQLAEEGRIPSLPIYVDSPLAVSATAVFEKHFECFRGSFRDWARQNGDPFARMNITYITDVEVSKKLNDLRQSCIILSASGMAEAGRIRHHIRNHIDDDRNIILFVGFCAANTLGARLVAREPVVNIFGEPHRVRAQIESMDAFSGHADQSELDDYVRKVTGRLRGCFIVHGEQSRAEAMAAHVRRFRPGAPVFVPSLGDSVNF